MKGSDRLGEVWLDSARVITEVFNRSGPIADFSLSLQPTGAAQFTHLLNPQATWSHTRPSNTISIRSSISLNTSHQLEGPHTFITTLATAQAALQRRTRIVDPIGPSIPVGFLGYLGYEMKEVSMPLCKSPTAAKEEERTDSEFALASLVLTYSHEEENWVATGLVRVGNDIEEGEELLEDFGLGENEWETWLTKVRSFLDAERTMDLSSRPVGPVAITGLVPDLNRDEYMAAIEHARESIIAGDAYELCMTTQFRTTISTSLADDTYSLYLSLRAANPAPYSYYFRLPLSNLTLLSSSPERFMRIDKARHAEMKPIKGTVRRSNDPIEDQRRKEALEADEKERAENLMIVDLSRNDLLGFCSVESVQVPRLMVVESYQTVHQWVLLKKTARPRLQLTFPFSADSSPASSALLHPSSTPSRPSAELSLQVSYVLPPSFTFTQTSPTVRLDDWSAQVAIAQAARRSGRPSTSRSVLGCDLRFPMLAYCC